MERKRRVLIVDDNESFRDVLKEILTNQGIFVEEVPNGLAALVEIQKAFPHFDLIISDIRMTALNGFELIKIILELNYIAPIMIISGILTDFDKEAICEKNIIACLDKPIKLEELWDAISKGFEEYDFRVNMIQKMIAQTKERHHNH